MVDGIKDGAAPKAVTTYMEEESRRDFEAGKATFMRNWPYAYALGKKNKDVKGKFEVVPFPEFEGGGKAGILGGHNQVISVVLEEPGRRAEAASTTSPSEEQPDAQTRRVLAVARRSTATYDDPEVQKAYRSRTSSSRRSRRRRRARSRRSTRRSRRRSTRTSTRRCRAQVSPEEALKKAQTEMETGAGDLLIAMAKHGHRHSGRSRAKRRSRGVPERRLAWFMVAPSMVLIALVAVYPIIYAIWLSLHQYSLHAGRACRAGPSRTRRSATTPTRSGADAASSGTAIADDVRLHDRLGDPRADPRARDGAWPCTRRSRARACCARSCSCRGRCSRSSRRSCGRRSSSPNLGFVNTCSVPSGTGRHGLARGGAAGADRDDLRRRLEDGAVHGAAAARRPAGDTRARSTRRRRSTARRRGSASRRSRCRC